MNAADFPRVGLQDAIAALCAMPGYLEAAIATASPGELTLSPDENGFSLVEQACHLRDLSRSPTSSR